MTRETGDGASGESARVEPAGDGAFDALAAAVGEGAYRLDDEGRFEAVNDVLGDLVGYDREELIGEPFSSVVAEEDVEAVEAAIRELQLGQDGDVGDVEVSIRTASGERIPCALRLAAIEADGRFAGTAGSLRVDAEDRPEVEVLERERDALESELDEALDRVSDAFFAVDAEGRFTYVNERAGELLERDPETLVGEDVFEELHGTEDSPFVRHTLDAIEGGETVSFEEFYPRVSRWFRVRLYPSETGVSVYFDDVTEEKRRESVLEQYEMVVEAVDDGVYAVDENYRFTLVNDAYCRLTGYDREELVGEHISMVVDESTIRMAEGLRERLRDGEDESSSVEVEIVRSDGERLTVEVRYTAVPGEEFAGTVGVVRDVSERKAFEDTLAALHEASRELHVAETADDVDRIVMETVTDVLDLSAATLFHYDEGTHEMVPALQTSAPGQELPNLPAGEESLAGHVYGGGEFRAYDDIRETTYVDEPMTEMRAGLFAPVGGDRLLVANSTEPGAFDERMERLVEILAGNATAALERQERERELRDSERRYRMLVDNFPNGAVALYDEACHYVAVGGQMYDRIDLSPEDAVGKTVGERLSGEIAETLESMIQGAFEEESAVAEATYDGRDFRLQSLPIRDDEEAVILAMVVTQDVTERKQAQEALEESERRFRTMMEQSPQSTQIFDPDGNTVAVNPAWERLWQSSEEAVREYNILEDEQLEEKGVMSYVERGFDGEAIEIPPVRYDPAEIGEEGRPRWVEAFLYPVFDEAGDTREIVLVHNDITESRVRKRELEQYETMVETVDDGVYVLGEGQFVFVNEAFAEMVGYDREELIGADVSRVTTGKYVDVIEEEIRRLEQGEVSVGTVESEILTAGGDRIPVEARFSLFPLEGGGHGRVGIVRDVSERRERERALKQSEQRYRTLVDNFPNGAVALVTPVDGALTYQTVGGSPIIETTIEEIEGSRVEDVLSPELADLVVPGYEAALDGESTTFEGESDGRVYQYQFVPVRDEDGEIFAALGMSQDVTERREYERALEESERRYRTLAENFPNGLVAIYDEDLRFELVEGQLMDEAGVSAEELEGMLAADVISAENRDDLEPVLRAALEGETTSVEVESDGRAYEVWAAPIRDDEGEVFAGLGFAMDVTERKERERELAEQRERYLGLVENAPVPIATYDAEGRLAYVNDAGVELLGADDPDDLVGEPAIEFIHPDDRAETGERMRRILEDRELAPSRETKLVDLDGEVRYAIIASAPITREGEPGGQVVLSDVTERKEYERRLTESEQRYRTLVESYPDGAVAMFDSDFRYTVAGGQLMEAEGVDPEERIGKSIFELYPEELLEEIEPYFHAALEGEENSFEVRYRGLDLFNYTLPVEGADGEVLGGMLVVNDVTEQREYERQLERFQTIIETVEDGVYTIDADGYITTVNSAYAEMVGRHREELIGMHATELVDEDVAEQAREIEAKLAEDPSATARLTAELKTDDDRALVAEATFALLPGDDEDYERVAVVRDVTERVERERELERALDLLHHTEDIADVGGWEIDPRTQEIFWTEHTYELQGFPPEDEPPLEEALEVYHPEDRAAVEAAIEAALEDGVPIDLEVRYTPRDSDEVRWFRLLGVPEVEDDEVVSLRGAAQDVTERVEREAELRERVEQEDAVTELGTFALEEPDLDRLFDRATDLVAETLDNDLCKLLELQPDGDTLALRAGRGWDDGLVGSATLGTGDDSIAGRTLQTEEAIIVEDIQAEDPADRPDLLTDHGGRSGVSVVVGTPSEPWGVLGTYDTDVREFSQQDVNFVQSVANILGIAIERANREEELHRRVEQQQVVTDLGKQALSDVDVDRLFDEAVARVAETLDNEYAKVLELQPGGESLLLRSGVGWRDGIVGEGTVGTGDDSQAGHTIRSEEPIVVTDLATEERFSGPELLTSHGVVSGISTVIGPHDDPWGVIGTHDTERREFSPQDVNFVQSVANILTTAIDRRAREREIESQRNRMAAIVRLSEIVQEVDQAVIEQSTREEIDRLVCTHLVESGEFAAAWVGDVNLASQTVSPRAMAGLPDDLVESVSFDASGEVAEDGHGGPTAAAAATGEPWTARVDHDEAAFPEIARERGYRSMAAIPLSFEDVRYGVLTLFSERANAFEGYELTVLEQLGRTVGHAVNAIDRKQALVGDSFTEIELRLPGIVEALEFPDGDDYSITVEGTVPAGGDRIIQYLTVTGVEPDAFLAVAEELPAVTDVRRIDGDGPSYRYEVTYDDPPITSTLASYGGRIESIAFDLPDLCITAAMPPSADVRQIVSTLRSEFPDLRVDAQRTVTRDHTSTGERRSAIEEDLTDRQRTALMTAFFAGYFEWSRESTGEEVAETLGVSPSTFHQHLRAAQRKVLTTLFEEE